MAEIFLILIRLLEISESGKLNFTSSSILPPNTKTAFFDSKSSSSILPDLYGIKYPSTFTYGKQYSEREAKFATALDTHTS